MAKTESRGMSNICFMCAKACGNCAWSRSFEPVPSWKAKPTKIKFSRGKMRYEVDSYWIVWCPEFVRG